MRHEQRILVESVVVRAPAYPAALSASDDTHAIGESIAQLAARIHSATYELLVLLAEFDTRVGWNNGCLSCAHWLLWRTRIALGASREKVRVARALRSLPRISASMRRGQVSYAKVRAMSRVATPAHEQTLLDFALAGTASQVERFTRAWRRVDEAKAGPDDTSRHLRREFSMLVDDDGMVVVRGRLTPEVGAVFQRALEAASDRLFQEARSTPLAATRAEEVTPAQRRADGIALLAETALSAGLDGGTAGDRYQVIVHVSAETSPGRANRRPSAADEEATIELDHGALHVSAETSRRLACDASVIRMDHGENGDILSVGRKTRTVPPSIRRSLAARDRRCRFPGCPSRRCDAHHIEHWADGGATSLDNLALLCRRHHRAVHEGRFDVLRHEDGEPRFRRPDGRLLEVVPPLPVVNQAQPLPSEPAEFTLSTCDGTRLDMGWALDILHGRFTHAEPRREELVGALPV